MASAKPAAEHQARKYLNVADPLLVRDNKNCKHRYDGNWNPSPTPDGSNRSYD
jgi:hypothetical protein